MGVDWFRFRVPPDASHAELAQLVREQAAAYQAWLKLWDDTSPDVDWQEKPYESKAGRALLSAYGSSSDALEDRLEFLDDHSEEFPLAWRVLVMQSPVIPLEMRREAHRTILPDELPGQLKAWQEYVTTVRDGGHRAYLFELYLHEQSASMRSLWRDLRATAARTADADEAWAKEPRLEKTRERAAQLPEPIQHPAPRWPHEGELTARVAEEDPRFVALRRSAVDLFSTIGAFNDSVPKRAGKFHGVPFYLEEHPASVEDLAARAEDPWLTAFLAWVQRCCALGQGLFHDA